MSETFEASRPVVSRTRSQGLMGVYRHTHVRPSTETTWYVSETYLIRIRDVRGEVDR
jgi:hypothetical protein